MRVLKYGAWLVAQGFSSKPDIDSEESYSPIIKENIISLLISIF